MVTPIVPTSVLGKAFDSCVQLIAESSTFQTETGSANAAAALDHIYEYEIEGVSTKRPAAVVDLGENISFNRKRGLSCPGELFVLDAAIMFSLTIDIVRGDARADRPFLALLNFAGNVAEQMVANFGDGTIDVFGFDNIQIVGLPERPPADRRPTQDFWVIDLMISRTLDF